MFLTGRDGAHRPPRCVRAHAELYHDLLGEIVADWRAARDAEQERRGLEARLKAQEQRALEAADRRHKDRELRIVRRALVAVSVVMGLLALAVGWALHERNIARDAQKRSRSQALAASAIGRISVDPQLSLMLATAAMKTAPTAAAEDALRRALSASRIRGRLDVGPTVAALIDDRADLLATVGPRGASLWRPADRRKLVASTRLRSDSGVAAIAAHGAAVAVDSDLDTFILRPTSGARLVELEHGGGLSWIRLSPDGRYATGTDARVVTRVWETRSGRALARLPAGHAVSAGEFDPADARRIVAGNCQSDAVTVWRWSRPARPKRRPVSAGRRPPGPSVARPWAAAPVEGLGDCAITVSRDGSRAVETLRDGSARLWDLRGERILVPRLPGVDETVLDTAWSSDSRRFAVAAGEAATVFSASGRLIATSQSHTDTVNTVALNRCGDLLATAGNDGIARVSDALTGAALEDLRGHSNWVLNAAFAGDGRSVVTVSADGTSARWAVETGRVLRGHTDRVLDAAFSADGKRVITGGNDGVVRIWNASARRGVPLSGRSHSPTASVASVAFSLGGRQIVAAANDVAGRGHIIFADAASGRLDARREIVSLLGTTRRSRPTRDALLRLPETNRRRPAEDTAITAVPALRTAELSPDGRWLLTTSNWHQTWLWDLSNGARSRLTVPLSFWQWALSATYSPDGRLIVTAGYDGVARVFTARTLQLRATLHRRGALYGATFSRNGRRVVSYGADGTAQIWDPLSRHPRALILRGHTGRVSTGDFSPDERRVVTGGADKTTRVWDARTGKLLSTQKMHGSIVNSVAFSPDGGTILSTSDDRTARLYPCETCAETVQFAAPRRAACVPAVRRRGAARVRRRLRPVSAHQREHGSSDLFGVACVAYGPQLADGIARLLRRVVRRGSATALPDNRSEGRASL